MTEIDQVEQDLRLTFDIEHKTFVICVGSNDSLSLYVDNCLRKRDATKDPTAYVWTNIELHWEEHRYVEARLNRSARELLVTVNGDTIYRERLPAVTNRV